MARRCMITGKGVQTGNNVSHANNKTRRRFMPNVKHTSLYSEALQQWVRLRATPAGLRTVEHRGGFDAFLIGSAPTDLDPKLRPIRERVEKALAKKA